jgi:hypothetical protein
LSHLPTTSKDNEVSEKHMDILDIIGKVFEFANQNFESGKRLKIILTIRNLELTSAN